VELDGASPDVAAAGPRSPLVDPLSAGLPQARNRVSRHHHAVRHGDDTLQVVVIDHVDEDQIAEYRSSAFKFLFTSAHKSHSGTSKVVQGDFR
jgi:hypothetical protein